MRVGVEHACAWVVGHAGGGSISGVLPEIAHMEGAGRHIRSTQVIIIVAEALGIGEAAAQRLLGGVAVVWIQE